MGIGKWSNGQKKFIHLPGKFSSIQTMPKMKYHKTVTNNQNEDWEIDWDNKQLEAIRRITKFGQIFCNNGCLKTMKMQQFDAGIYTGPYGALHIRHRNLCLGLK